MFCPECGATDVEMIDGICKNCFLKKFQLMEIPENITVTICKHCNAKLEEGNGKMSTFQKRKSSIGHWRETSPFTI